MSYSLVELQEVEEEIVFPTQIENTQDNVVFSGRGFRLHTSRSQLRRIWAFFRTRWTHPLLVIPLLLLFAIILLPMACMRGGSPNSTSEESSTEDCQSRESVNPRDRCFL